MEHDQLRWLASVTRGDTTNQVATKAGLVHSTLYRQLRRGELTVDVIAAIARGYDHGLLDAFVACGVVAIADVEKFGARIALERATDKEIAAEVMRRLGGS